MSELYQVLYSPQALEDIKDIYRYIAYELRVPGTAQKQVDRLRKTVRSLDRMPARHAVVDWEPWRSMGMHKVPVGRFLIFYTVAPAAKDVTIVRIVYGGRDLENLAKLDGES